MSGVPSCLTKREAFLWRREFYIGLNLSIYETQQLLDVKSGNIAQLNFKIFLLKSNFNYTLCNAVVLRRVNFFKKVT